MKKNFRNYCVAIIVLYVFTTVIPAQKPKPTITLMGSKSIIFAVLNDGLSLEPIAYIEKGKLQPTVNGSDEESLIVAFNRAFYKKGSVYNLIFGGASVGTASVKSSNASAECSKNVGTSTVKTPKTPLKGNVMALATNATVKSKASFRRKPTAAEKDEADGLARAEFAKEKLTPKVLRFHNLTALDVDSDGKAEMVGSYWVEIDKSTRGLLFFIASKGSNGKYSTGFTEYQLVDQSKIMGGGEIKDIDDGIYNELLLDTFDYDADGTGEIFTYRAGYEGAGFNVYRRNGLKWTKSFEGSNYHCGF